MNCPRCKLICPDSQTVCDCGYSFRTGTVGAAAKDVEMPRHVHNILALCLLLPILFGALVAASGDGREIVYWAVQSAIVWSTYSLFRYGWARFAFFLATFPLSLFIVGWLLSPQGDAFYLRKAWDEGKRNGTGRGATA